jgi:NAD(P)-dependent dehydrogenase (short-subunit alcohol dehydrogenase family)
MELAAGKIAVVTGAASGIGLALAKRFADAGLNVGLADVDDDGLSGAAEVIGAHGVVTLVVPTDGSVEPSVQGLAPATMDRFGAVHVVCNNAGVATLADRWFGPLSAWEWGIGVNMWGVIRGVRALPPHLTVGGEGHIVNTGRVRRFDAGDRCQLRRQQARRGGDEGEPPHDAPASRRAGRSERPVSGVGANRHHGRRQELARPRG